MAGAPPHGGYLGRAAGQEACSGCRGRLQHQRLTSSTGSERRLLGGSWSASKPWRHLETVPAPCRRLASLCRCRTGPRQKARRSAPGRAPARWGSRIPAEADRAFPRRSCPPTRGLLQRWPQLAALVPKKGPRTGARGRERLCANRSARLLGIKARLRYRRPSQLQHKGPHAAQAAPLPLPRQPPRPQDRRPAPGPERDRAPGLEDRKPAGIYRQLASLCR